VAADEGPASSLLPGSGAGSRRFASFERGNGNGAQTLLAKSVAKLEQYPDRFCGIDNRNLVAYLRKSLQDSTPQPFRIER
jgi:hypothetical protein